MIIATIFGAIAPLTRAQIIGDVPPPAPSATSTTSANPPITQTVVPEGALALRLVERLKLKPTTDAADAEQQLSQLGIEPQNGWITDYPVTPAVSGELQTSVARAADAGSLPMAREAAIAQVRHLLADLSLESSPGAASQVPTDSKPGNLRVYKYRDSKGVVHLTDQIDSVEAGFRDKLETIEMKPPPPYVRTPGEAQTVADVPQYATNPDADDLNRYYAEQGPPAMTYYAPPEPYSYLYSWVPYPFWTRGFSFSGFFILRDFHRSVVFGHRRFFVSNHASPGVVPPMAGIGPSLSPALPGRSGSVMPGTLARQPGFPVAQHGGQTQPAFRPRNLTAGNPMLGRVPLSPMIPAPRVHPSMGQASSIPGSWTSPPIRPSNHFSAPPGGIAPFAFNRGPLMAPPAFSGVSHGFPGGPRFAAPMSGGNPSFGGFHGGGGFRMGGRGMHR